MDVTVFAELLGEGVEPRMIGKRVFFRRKLTDKARSILEEHGDEIAATVRAIAAGKTTYLQLAQRLAPGFQWPGTLDHVPVYPGRLAFAVGVEWRNCRDCARLVGMRIFDATCGRYEAPTARYNPRGVRCIAFVPKGKDEERAS